MKKLVAFTGHAGAGKTTAAAALAASHVRMSFATPIRQMLVALGLSADQMANRKNEPIAWLGGKTPRELMQTLGTEWGREHVAQDIWLGVARERMRVFWEAAPDAGIVFDDCRFDNEAALIRDMGGIVVRVCGRGMAVPAHPSEAGVNPLFLTANVLNNGDADSFVDMVRDLIYNG